MNKINTGDMNGRAKKLYEKMWGNFEFDSIGATIKKTHSTRYEKDSDNSYCFDGGDDKEQLLIQIFGIENTGVFSEKFKMATTGSGDEALKITTLHSSSLCALLHFYNVTEDKDNYNPLILELETNKHKRKVRFTSSVFEYKSKVIKNPSNMDVVLIGKDLSTDEKIVLFLESKFSEYFLGASSVRHKVSREYCEACEFSKPLYEDSFLKNLGLRKGKESDLYYKLESFNRKQVYIEGLKQMISHYTGIMNLLRGDPYVEKDKDRIEIQKEVEEALDSGAIAILGEIIFDGRIKALAGDDYTKRYKVLASRVAELTKENERFEIVMNDLKYSLFKDNTHRIEPKIKDFYRQYE